MPECQMRAKLVRERPHRVVLRTGRYPQNAIAIGAGFRDQFLGIKCFRRPLRRSAVSTLKAISGCKSGDVSGG